MSKIIIHASIFTFYDFLHYMIQISQFLGLFDFSKLLQSLCIRVETEFYRRQRYDTANTMGTLYWQLTQKWQAPSWTSLEYTGKY